MDCGSSSSLLLLEPSAGAARALLSVEARAAAAAVQAAARLVQAATLERDNAQTAATHAATAPVLITMSFDASPTVAMMTSLPIWQQAENTYREASLTLLNKQGAREEAKKSLVTAQATQATMSNQCECDAKAAYAAAVTREASHRAMNEASWTKAERLICALDGTEPCPNSFPGHPTARTLPDAVSSKTDAECGTK